MADHVAHDVFVSYENRDSDVALEIAARLNAMGYTAWCYEKDASAGGSYLVQVDRAIEAAKAVVVIVSEHSVRSPHVRNEVIRAYESRKRFIPVRRDIAHDTMLTALDDADDERRREWRMAFGASVSLTWDAGDAVGTMANMEKGLRQFGILPRDDAPQPLPLGSASLREPARRTPTGHSPAEMMAPVRRSIIAQRTVLAVVALLGLVMSARNVITAFVDPVQLHFYRFFPAALYLNVLANLTGLIMFGLLAKHLLQFFQGRSISAASVRQLAGVELLVVIAWSLASFVVALSAPSSYARLRTDYMAGIVVAAVFGAAPVALLRWMYADVTTRHPEQTTP
jgi:hypothetical protein